MKFKEGQLIIKTIHPEADDRKVEKGGIVKVLSSSFNPEYDLFVEVVKSKNLPTSMHGIIDSSHYKAFHTTLLKRKSNEKISNNKNNI